MFKNCGHGYIGTYGERFMWRYLGENYMFLGLACTCCNSFGQLLNLLAYIFLMP